MMKTYESNLIRDLLIIGASVFISIFLVESGIILKILSYASELELISSFIAGIFFTSVFSVSISTAALAEISTQSESILLVAIFGALGALCGDLIIFRFIKDTLLKDIELLMSHIKAGNFLHAFHLRPAKWLTPFIGALIIMSPLPDELGIAIIGFSKLGVLSFIPISFLFNFLGIITIALIAKNFF